MDREMTEISVETVNAKEEMCLEEFTLTGDYSAYDNFGWIAKSYLFEWYGLGQSLKGNIESNSNSNPLHY